MKSVLIADDDRILRKMLSIALKSVSETLRIFEAEDGQVAIDILEAEKIDLVITDINMPRLNGLMVIAYLNIFFPGLPCFVMTAYGTSRLKSKLPRDLLKFYHKPLTVPELVADVVAVLANGPTGEERPTVSLANFLELVALEGQTCTVTVESEGTAPCHLFIEKGMLLDAFMGDRRGEAVAIEAMSRPGVSFSLEQGCPETIQKTINRSLEELILKLDGSS
jgi:CheY-like chemotaxis protein